MKKTFLFSFFICLFSCNYLFAEKQYAEDNAAYWYQKAFNELINFYDQDNFYMTEEGKKVTSITSLEDYKQLNRITIKKFDKLFDTFNYNLKKAKSLDKCVFWEMPENDSDEKNQQFNDTRIFYKAFKIANALAWYSISNNRPQYADRIWKSMLETAINVSEHNLGNIRTTSAGITLKIVIPSLENYYKNGASEEFKSNFNNFFKNWPKSIFNMNDMIKVLYEYQRTNVELYGKNQKFLATLFGADTRVLLSKKKPEPRRIENPDCASQLRVVQGAIEMFQMDEVNCSENLAPDLSSIDDERMKRKAYSLYKSIQNTKTQIKQLKKELAEQKDKPQEIKENTKPKDDFGEFGLEDNEEEESAEKKLKRYETKLKDMESILKNMGVEIKEAKNSSDFPDMTWDEVIGILKSNLYLRNYDNYDCPHKGKRTIKAIKQGNETSFEITCTCAKIEIPEDDYKPDSKPMTTAKAYREKQFDKDKKQLFEYFDKLLKIDHTKPMTDEEMTSLTAVEMPEYQNNVLISYFTFDYKRIRKSFEEKQKLIDDFLENNK